MVTTAVRVLAVAFQPRQRVRQQHNTSGGTNDTELDEIHIVSTIGRRTARQALAITNPLEKRLAVPRTR